MSERRMRRARERQVERKQGRERVPSRRSRLAAGAGAALGATVVFAPAAEAETLTVTNLDNDGGGSLRETIQDANANGEDDVITFAAGLTGTIDLEDPDADLEIYNEGLQIQGPGADVLTIDANGEDRIFYIVEMDDPDEIVSISGLTLTGGLYDNLGGALYSDTGGGPPSEGFFAADVTIADSVLTGNEADGGGAIWTDYGSLTILNSAFTDNEAVYDRGGALYTNDTDGDGGAEVVIRNSVFTGNTATGSDDYFDGGGAVTVAQADGDVLIENTTFSANTAGQDGGGALLYDTEGDVLVRNSTFAGNAAEGGYGGGLALYDNENETIEGSTFSGNTSYYDGGGAVLWGTGGDLLVQSSTFSGNTAGTSTEDGPYNGGGLYSYNRDRDPEPDEDTERTIRNTTIVNNTADTGGGIAAYLVSADGADTEDVLALSSTIVANNTPEDLSANEHPNSDPPDGTFASGFSLIENPGGVPNAEAPAGSNIFGVDPLLGPLASNGGPTQTHLPAFNSPALDKGISNGLGQDQRGLARVQDLSAVANAAGGDGTDIGSTEVQAGDCRGQSVPKIDGSSGNDTLTGTPGPDAISALAGNDTANGAAGNDCVKGDEGKDTAKGGPGKDLVNGGKGKDKVRGGGGKDKAKGGAGRDNVTGGGGKDKVSGQGGKDTLKGGGGKDRLKGGPGRDRIKPGGGKDRVNCGGGNDKVTVSPQDKVSNNCEKVVETG